MAKVCVSSSTGLGLKWCVELAEEFGFAKPCCSNFISHCPKGQTYQSFVLCFWLEKHRFLLQLDGLTVDSWRCSVKYIFHFGWRFTFFFTWGWLFGGHLLSHCIFASFRRFSKYNYIWLMYGHRTTKEEAKWYKKGHEVPLIA